MRKLFCDSWYFTKTDLSAEFSDIGTEKYETREVTLPHDWLIYNTKDLYENSIGWYQRKLCLSELLQLGYTDRSRVYIRFDGVYMNSTLYVNGKSVCEWKYGYSAFGADITDFLSGEENVITVKAVHESPNSRWYSGAGIYRDVYIEVTGEEYLRWDGTYVHTEKSEEGFTLFAETEISTLNGPEKLTGKKLVWSLCGPDGKRIAKAEKVIEPEKLRKIKNSCLYHHYSEKAETYSAGTRIFVKSPKLWSTKNPAVYSLTAALLDNKDRILDDDEINVGFRTTEFDPDRGFMLNGEQLRIHGVCEHHDFGALGAAYSDAAMRRKIRILKEMGVNAIRTSHNMPAELLLEAADEEGILILSEAFDMWEQKKTDFDYARFFNEWADADVESWIRRDRNHPSVFMWSIGNEIHDTHADPERASEIIDRLSNCVLRNDPAGNARITLCSNYLPWEQTQKCMDKIKLAGYNYGERLYREHHEKHPDWIIFGSETASVVSSRGVYKFPYATPYLSDDDEQCSALGNSNTSWGAKSYEAIVSEDRDAGCCFGQFIWTGFDYIGEPTPYHTKNSYFGMIDTAGFPKDPYFIIKAGWSAEDKDAAPMVHVFPYWDFTEGQQVDVRIASNAHRVELLVNGKKAGEKVLNHKSGTDFTASFTVPYEKGEITAVAYDETGKPVASETRKSFGDPESIEAFADRSGLKADGRDIAFIEISTKDFERNTVENAMNYITAKVIGPAFIAGMDNGDSTDFDEYKTDTKRLFNGRLMLAVRTRTTPGNITVILTGAGLEEKVITLKSHACDNGNGFPEGVKTVEYIHEGTEISCIPVRKISLFSSGGNIIKADNPETTVNAVVFPENATDGKLEFKAVNMAGIEIGHVKLEKLSEKSVRVVPKGDGQFKIRALSKSGTDRVHIIGELVLTAEGFGEPFFNPYEFIGGGLYSEAVGELGNGNEKGVSTARGEKSAVVFNNIDFGTDGSDEITIPIFALTDEPLAFKIYEGRPGDEGSCILADEIYHKKMIWNVYQEHTCRLSKVLTGIKTVSIEFCDKVHIKGIVFRKLNRSFDYRKASERIRVYGDSFTENGDCIENIGNNVVVELGEYDFTGCSPESVVLTAYTPLKSNTVHLHFYGEDKTEIRRILEFKHSESYEEQSFSLVLEDGTSEISGKYEVKLVFLPGSEISIKGIQFFSNYYKGI